MKEIILIAGILLPVLAYPIMRGLVPLRSRRPMLFPIGRVNLMIGIGIFWVAVAMWIVLPADTRNQTLLLLRAILQILVICLIVALPLKKILRRYDPSWAERTTGYEVWGLSRRDSIKCLMQALSKLAVQCEEREHSIYLPEYDVEIHTGNAFLRLTGFRFWVEGLENKILALEVARQLSELFLEETSLDPANCWIELSSPLALALFCSLFV